MVCAMAGHSALFRTDDVAQLRGRGSEGRRDVEVEESIAPRKTPMRCSWCSPPAERGSGRKTSVGGRLLGPRLGPGTDAVVAVQRQPSERTAQSLLGVRGCSDPKGAQAAILTRTLTPHWREIDALDLGGPEKEGLGGSEGKVQTGLERGKISTSIIPSTHFSFICPAPASRQGTRLETTVDHLQASTSPSHTYLPTFASPSQLGFPPAQCHGTVRAHTF